MKNAKVELYPPGGRAGDAVPPAPCYLKPPQQGVENAYSSKAEALETETQQLSLPGRETGRERKKTTVMNIYQA